MIDTIIGDTLTKGKEKDLNEQFDMNLIMG